MPTSPAPEQAPAPRKTTQLSPAPDRARLVVDVPADAKLYVDGQLMKTKSENRVFNTPTLRPGQAYYYDLKAEVVRDGESKTESKRVIVRGGETARASFRELDTVNTNRATASARP
jgi:uncharacterized protein (TIGR03000 family)